MSDPLLHVAVDVDGDAAGPEGVVREPEHETWLVKPSQPRWQVWRDHNRRRPPTWAEKRGRAAAATAGTILGVLGCAGTASYAIQYLGLHREAVDQVESFGGQSPANMVQKEQKYSSDIQQAIHHTAGAARGSSGLIGVVNGEVAGVSPTAARAAADKGFLSDAVRKAKNGDNLEADTYVSGSSVCVYTVGTIDWRGESVVVMDVYDLTPDLNRINGAYLTYGLGSLAGAGTAGGAVWWGLGRRRDSAAEPDEV